MEKIMRGIKIIEDSDGKKQERENVKKRIN